MKTSIALIGFMGTGKTVVGRVLAEKLGKKFVELDNLIVRKAGKIIPEIFQQDGEMAFRELEIGAAREISGKKNVVIAGGGGVVLNKINIDRLRKECLMVYLTASPEVILKRTSTDRNDRPLLATADQESTIRELLEFRRPFYRRAADITIDTSVLDIKAVVGQIIETMKETESV
ncbi:MAG: shikimate kinase [Dehalococcoidales bacterium]|jgi:shikimate kinase|nr:shikimate kinase [Dehalococcoidales bacterium]